MNRFVVNTRLTVPAGEAFAWHERPGALERMSPPWEGVHVVAREGTIHDGDRVVVELRGLPVPVRFEHVHRDFVAGRQFRDEQVRGPFRRFVHTHTIEPDGDGASVLTDAIEYALPLGGLGLADRFVRARLARAFAYRHAVLAHDLARHAAVRARGRLRIAVTGASGVLGRPLCAFLSTGGHDVLRLVRRAAGPGEIHWDPARGEIDAAALEGVDAVVHLAGENVGSRRWSAEHKREILRSRVDGTGLVARTLARLSRPPRVMVSASGVGYYGVATSGPVDETAPAGDDFLADVCRQWEDAAAPARAAGVRVVNLRIGVVLTPDGGALAEMLPIFRAGLGGPLGNGRQMMSWISPDDAIAAIHHAVFTDELAGAVNAAAPHAVSNADYARTLAHVLHRPSLLRVPAAAIELAFGELGRLVALGGVDAKPLRLEGTGFAFAFAELEPALRHTLGRSLSTSGPPKPPLPSHSTDIR